MYEPQRWYLGFSCPSNGKQIIILLGMLKFSTPGIPKSPTLADVRTDEMSKEMREEWMQDAQNQQLGSSGIRGQSSAYCLIDLMSNYMGGCVKIGHPKFHGFNVGTRLVGWYSIVAIFFSPYSVPWCLVGASIVASCFQIFLKVFFHFFDSHFVCLLFFLFFEFTFKIINSVFQFFSFFIFLILKLSNARFPNNFDWNFGVYTLVWTHPCGGFTPKDLRSPSAEDLEFLQGDKRIKPNDLGMALVGWRGERSEQYEMIVFVSTCFFNFRWEDDGRWCSALPVNAACGLFSLLWSCQATQRSLPLRVSGRKWSWTSTWRTKSKMAGAPRNVLEKMGSPFFIPVF